MYPTLRFGRLVLSSYTILVDLGLLLGGLLSLLRARRRGYDVGHMLDALLVAALGGLVVARAAYVMFHWTYYSDHALQALRLHDGGLAWQGAVVGGLIAAAIYCSRRASSLLNLLDVLTPGVALLAIFAWLGCLMVGCAYGIETYPPQPLWTLSMDLPDLYGIRAPRVAVQLLGAGWSAFSLMGVLVVERRAERTGLLFPFWLMLYGMGAFSLGFLRGDEVLLVADWRLDQLVDLALIAGGVVSWLRQMLRGV